MTPPLSCDPDELKRVEQEIERNERNLGVGVLDKTTGVVRLFNFDETVAFVVANPHLQVMTGHDAAAAMAGFSESDARGFAVVKEAGVWAVANRSHLNRPDGHANLEMDDDLFREVLNVLRAAGAKALNP